MNLRCLLTTGILALASQQAVAAFQELPTTAPLRVTGANNLAVDKLFIPTGSIVSTDVNGINTYAAPTTFQLLASNETEVELEGEEVGTFFDYVFRDTSDNKLVFGGRLALDEDGEINDVFRSGFTDYSAAAAWTFLTDLDLRAYSAARTATGLLEGADVFSPDVIAFRSDINLEEGNPFTGLYLIKSNAPWYQLSANALRLRQGGEEGQEVTNVIFAGYTPAAAIPEPDTYAILVAGLGLVGLLSYRRRRNSGV